MNWHPCVARTKMSDEARIIRLVFACRVVLTWLFKDSMVPRRVVELLCVHGDCIVNYRL